MVEIPPSSVARPTRRVFVIDEHTSKKCLIDSDAEISVFPPTICAQLASDITFTTANGTRIRTYGPKTLRLDFGLKRIFAWTFEMADVARPIIGADFLHYFGLLVDVKRNRLIDPEAHSTVKTIAIDIVDIPVFTVARSLKFTELLRDFPDVTRNTDTV